MREVLSIRIDAETKKRLNALAQRMKQSRSLVAAEHSKRRKPESGGSGKAR